MAKDTTKVANDYFTAGNTAFKESIEKSMSAFAELNAYSKKNLEAMVASMTAAAKRARHRLLEEVG
jgi:hypothetical protein